MEMTMARPRKNTQEPAIQLEMFDDVEKVTQEVTPQVVVIEHQPDIDEEIPASTRAELEAGRAALARNAQ
jgi:hypothetical protein